MKNLHQIREDSLNEKFNDRQAEQTLKGLQMVYGQAKKTGK